MCGKEDVKERGFFDSGATFSLYQTPVDEMVGVLAENLRGGTLNEMKEKIAGDSEYTPVGGSGIDVFSMKYTADVPEVTFHTGITAPPQTMRFVQDIIVNRLHGYVLSMKYEAPGEDETEDEEVFETIKGFSCFLVENNNEHDFGITYYTENSGP